MWRHMQHMLPKRLCFAALHIELGSRKRRMHLHAHLNRVGFCIEHADFIAQIWVFPVDHGYIWAAGRGTTQD